MSVFLTRILSALVGNGVGPGEQIIQEACVRIVHVLGNLREQVLEIFIRFQTICLRCLHDAVDRGAGLGAVNGVKDTPIVAAYAEWSDRALTGRVIYGNAAVLQIHFQIPARLRQRPSRAAVPGPRQHRDQRGNGYRRVLHHAGRQPRGMPTFLLLGRR